ncbi:MAG TPA: DUF3052 domain-containing protein [Terriglobales bacterium]|nr:DUF3052 domain-containing protein [Terriglobales bacterium]
MAGYSGTPLVKKLGIKAGQRIALLSGPPGYRKTLGKLPEKVNCDEQLSGQLDFIQVFATTQAELKRSFSQAKRCLATDGSLWISWPKKASRVATDLNENVVREIGLGLGLVDVKVCAVDETWSGLKFVYRLKGRL